jgi:hypothetical protein
MRGPRASYVRRDPTDKIRLQGQGAAYYVHTIESLTIFVHYDVFLACYIIII